MTTERPAPITLATEDAQKIRDLLEQLGYGMLRPDDREEAWRLAHLLSRKIRGEA